MSRWVRIDERQERVAIVGCGPSLKEFDFRLLDPLPCVVAVNRAWKGARNATHWVTVDSRWIHETRPPDGFPGRRILAAPDDMGRPDAAYPCDRAKPPEDVDLMRRSPSLGLSEDPGMLHTINSAFGALNLAYHFRARKVALLGVDGNRLTEYFFGRRVSLRRDRELMNQLGDLFRSAVPQLRESGCEVVCGSPQSTVTCFDRRSPEEAIAWLLR